MVDRTGYPQWLRRPQASQYLAEIWGISYSASTLAKMCCLGTGPETSYWGKIAVHSPDSLDRFARSRIKSVRAVRRSRALHPSALAEMAVAP